MVGVSGNKWFENIRSRFSNEKKAYEMSLKDNRTAHVTKDLSELLKLEHTQRFIWSLRKVSSGSFQRYEPEDHIEDIIILENEIADRIQKINTLQKKRNALIRSRYQTLDEFIKKKKDELKQKYGIEEIKFRLEEPGPLWGEEDPYLGSLKFIDEKEKEFWHDEHLILQAVEHITGYPAIQAATLCPVRKTEKGKEVLLTKRTFWNKEKNRPMNYAGEWVFPGGKCEAQDSSPLDTAIREFKEELGYEGDITNASFSHSTYDTSEKEVCKIAFFTANINPEEVVSQSGEVLEARWMTPAEWINLVQSEEFHNEQLNEYKKCGITERTIPHHTLSALYKHCFSSSF